MLGNADLIAFAPTRNPEAARAFYEQTLGLEFVSADPFAVVFNANDVMLRVVDVSPIKDFQPAPFTILGWHVASIESAVHDLAGKGIKFERFSGMSQDDLGIWRSPSGARIVWFKDPDGNVLSLTESP